INTVPRRARIDESAPVAAWLEAMQEEQRAAAPHDWAPLPALQAWSGMPPGRPLFQSVLVFENYPIDSALRPGLAGEVEEFRAPTRTAYPLSLVVVPGRELSLALGYDAREVDGARAAMLLRHLEAVLAAMSDAPDRTVGEIDVLSPADREALAAA